MIPAYNGNDMLVKPCETLNAARPQREVGKGLVTSVILTALNVCGEIIDWVGRIVLTYDMIKTAIDIIKRHH